MSFAKVAAIAVSLAAAFALGVWTGPYFTDADGRTATVGSERPSDGSAGTAATATRRAPMRRGAREAPAMAASEPAVHEQLKPVMNHGTKMTIASEGFRDAEQFAVVAHAARNTGIPFMVLKHRLLDEGKTLSRAIEQSKPALDGAAEARRARTEAREDLAEVRQAREPAEVREARGRRG